MKSWIKTKNIEFLRGINENKKTQRKHGRFSEEFLSDWVLQFDIYSQQIGTLEALEFKRGKRKIEIKKKKKKKETLCSKKIV